MGIFQACNCWSIGIRVAQWVTTSCRASGLVVTLAPSWNLSAHELPQFLYGVCMWFLRHHQGGATWIPTDCSLSSLESFKNSYSSSATNKALCRIWNITIYRLVVMSETIHRTVQRKPESWK